MLVGSMNDARASLEQELRRIADAAFDFVDLTLEPPGSWPADGASIGALLADLGLSAVGHTAPYLPHASPFPELRREALAVFRAAFETFAGAGITLVTMHPNPVPGVSLEEARKRNAESIAELAADARASGVQLMVENLGRSFTHPGDLAPIFDAAPDVRFHLDVGHAHMWRGPGEPNRTASLLAAFGEQLAHVHVHDNVGGHDLHLPLGVGTVDWPGVVRALKGAGWDGTVTVEVFAGERAYLDLSRGLWLEWWAAET